jgi:hypothetical protein
VIAYGACVPSGMPVGVGFALGIASAIAGPCFDGAACRLAHPCTIAIADARMTNASARQFDR